MIESFEQRMKIFRENLDAMYDNGHMTNWADVDTSVDLDRLQRAHDHEIEQLRRSRFREGYEAGQRSMDAAHYLLKLRLQGLRFGDGSHENLSRLAYAIYPCPTGWGKESCEGLRDKLIELLGGVHDEPAPIPASRCACDADCDCGHGDETSVAYDELGNERHKAVCELRNVQMDTGNAVKKLAIALGVKWNLDNAQKSIALLQSRLIHLLGGDEPLPNFSELFQNFSRTFAEPNLTKSAEIAKPESEGGGENCRITDELREFVAETWDGSMYVNQIPKNLQAIADRIDEQFDRCCELWERVAHDAIHAQVKSEEERDALREEVGSLKLAAGRDADQMESLNLSLEEVTAERDELQKKLEEYERRDTAESIVRDIHLGKVTDSQAVERIRALR